MESKARNIFDDVSTWEINKKLVFSERLLFQMTVMNRAIWSDDNISDKVKTKYLKWSNELAHQVWNKVFELQKGLDNDAIGSIQEDILFYRKQSQILGGHLGTTLKLTANYFYETK